MWCMKTIARYIGEPEKIFVNDKSEERVEVVIRKAGSGGDKDEKQAI
jgi:hypothetical protein